MVRLNLVLGLAQPPQATAIVPGIAKEFVNPKLPTKREAQAKLKRMSYRSYLEFMAERYHTSEDFLIELNGRKTAYNLAPRKAIKVPNNNPIHPKISALCRLYRSNAARRTGMPEA